MANIENLEFQEISKLPATEDDSKAFAVVSNEDGGTNTAKKYPLSKKADKEYVLNVESKVNTLNNKITNDKGYFSTEAGLLAAYPIPIPGNYANVAGIMYECQVRGTWINTGNAAPTPELELSEYAKNGGSDKTVQQIDDEKANRIVPHLENVDLDIITSSQNANQRAYYNIDPVKSDGILSKVRVKMYSAGLLHIIVLRKDVEPGYFMSEVARFDAMTVVGINSIDISGINVKRGDYIALSNNSSTRLSMVVTSTPPYSRGQTDLTTDDPQPYKVTSENSNSDLYFLYNFDVVSDIENVVNNINSISIETDNNSNNIENINQELSEQQNSIIKIENILTETVKYNEAVDLDISATRGNSANLRAYYNLDPVKSDGILKTFRYVTQSANGTLHIVVLRPNIQEGIYLKEVARYDAPVINGKNIINIDEVIEVKKGDYIGIINTSSLRASFITTASAPNVIPRGQSDVYTDVNAPIVVTNQNSSNLLYFLYNFDVVSDRILGDGKTIQTYGDSSVTGNQTLEGWVSIGDEFDQDGTLTKISVNGITSAGIYDFCVGIIDQRNWIIPSSEFSLNLLAGNNLQIIDIFVREGTRLFMKVDSRIQYDVTKGSMYFTPDIESEVSSVIGIYPISFDLTYYDSPFATKGEVQDVRQAVANIVIPDSTIRISPDGTKWRVGVDNDGNFTSRRIDIRKWLIIGNSFTIAPVTDIWWGQWGMAASRRENDYVHVLTGLIRQKYVNLEDPQIIWSGSTSWERTHNQNYDYTTKLAPYLSADTDLVVLRLGENVVDYTNYEANYGTYLDKIREYAPNAQIIATGVFWNNSTTDNAQRNAALSRGIPFVELSDLDQPQYKSFVGDVVWGDDGLQHTITTAGVGRHGNDDGQAKIAIRINTTIA